MEWETVIGLEIHVQLATQSKLFSGAATRYGAPPNSQACIVDLGMPGVLPVINAAAVEMAVRFGIAIGARINSPSIFARKNYFYPDLPKGYQISQYERPIVEQGSIEIAVDDAEPRHIRITRAHLEEDAGKSVHEGYGDQSAIDLNRAGTPLIEIVSEPDLRSAREAAEYMRRIHTLVRWLEISDGNMQEGSFRCDANVSIRPRGSDKLGTRAEIKNINSFRFVEQAINFEIERQIDVLESGGHVVQETRLFDSVRQETRSMRSKEEANDYRYFPDPDLLPVHIPDHTIAAIADSLPELPDARRHRYTEAHGLTPYDAANLTAQRELSDYFDATLTATGGNPKLCANWIMGDLSAALNRDGITVQNSPVSADALGGMLRRIEDGTISGKIAKQVFEAMWEGGGDADSIIEARGLRQVTDTGAIERIIETVIASSPDQVRQYLDSPPDRQAKLIGYFVGQVMKQSQGKANPQQVNQLLRTRLK